ncbi:ATP-NAD kinase family protein [Neptunicella marina]|uniref:ATP-NAD kinase family protein n=1 Tax=Neptunicella marina TaxID=2125989 RepID=A0A8J6IRG7_9ALTE|nr:ATP-NAD kinase family protein [Neptunicella marina]MBC3764522.1 ATP-NAD kinase family protein [Neptunicella marina]
MSFKLGLIINPWAGIGGAMALKGSDGKEVREQALAMGAIPKAQQRMREALEIILPYKKQVQIITAARDMGEALAHEMGFNVQVVYTPAHQQTEAIDSENAAYAMLDTKVDLLLFAGGDGTARNICSIVHTAMPVLGVPAGCKIHSGVYGVSPKASGRVVEKMLCGELVSVDTADVKDIDEEKFRQGKVIAKMYGEMQIPLELRYIQATKSGGKESEELVLADIADYISELMEDEYFVMGSGSTVAAVMQSLGLPNTLLGVDLVKEQQLIASDLTAQQLLDSIDNQPAKLVITLIGGQGHIFGRGNQQLSPQLIKQIGKENILLIATKTKLQALQGRPLLVDTGDAELDKSLSGFLPVITGYRDQVLYPVAAPGNE